MANSRQLDAQLHQTAWSIASRAPARAGTRPADPWDDDYAGTIPERRAGCLELLQVYAQMIKVLQSRIDLTVKQALANEASYGEIGAACGVSRQAARQRWLRHHERQGSPNTPPTGSPHDGDPQGIQADKPTDWVMARLVGGPRHGDWDRVKPGRLSRFPVAEPMPGTGGCEHIACYVPSEQEPGAYIFARMEYNPHPGMAGGAGILRPHVSELAHELGVETKDVMAKLVQMGEFVRSAASTVEPLAVRKLKEHFQATHARRDNAGPPETQITTPRPPETSTHSSRDQAGAEAHHKKPPAEGGGSCWCMALACVPPS